MIFGGVNNFLKPRLLFESERKRINIPVHGGTPKKDTTDILVSARTSNVRET